MLARGRAACRFAAMAAIAVLVICHSVAVLGVRAPGVPPHTALNMRPVVGMLTQPMSDSDGRELLVASYVKWIESAGARVVPVRFTTRPLSAMGDLLERLNGLVFPGGLDSIEGTEFAEAAMFAFNKSVALNDAGAVFPVWATCLGFEQLMTYSSAHPFNRSRALSAVDAEDIFVPFSWTPALKSSRLMSEAPSSVVETLATQNVTINMHEWGVLVDTFNSLPDLNEQWTSLATSKDRNGLEFVALVEHKKLPFYGSQNHFEKNGLEWSQGHPDYVHTADAIAAAQYFANTFVEATRQSQNQFPKEALQASLIYNYAPTFTGTDDHVEQTYFFE